MKAVDDVHLGQRLIVTLAQLVPRLLQRHRVGTAVAGLEARERTKETAGDAHVRRFEPEVVVLERAAAEPPLALAVGEPANGEKIRAFEELLTVGVVETEPLFELVGDWCEAGGRDAGRNHLVI